jgi:hypothetical protein
MALEDKVSNLVERGIFSQVIDGVATIAQAIARRTHRAD